MADVLRPRVASQPGALCRTVLLVLGQAVSISFGSTQQRRFLPGPSWWQSHPTLPRLPLPAPPPFHPDPSHLRIPPRRTLPSPQMYMVEPNKERVKLLGRKGYAKIAVEQQIDGVVPVYYFGNSQCLDMGPKSLSGISRKWRVSLALYMYGRFWLPLPRPVDLLLVHGRPIPVPKVDVCDKAAVEAAMNTVHDGLVKELQEMYDRHKKGYGWADRPLSIE
eukprot:365573-Chlamydomonas_euryale.AAC.18